jgi:hypothetical protein
MEDASANAHVLRFLGLPPTGIAIHWRSAEWTFDQIAGLMLSTAI